MEDVESWQGWLNLHPDLISEETSQALIDEGERLQLENQPFLAVEAYRMAAWVAERVGDHRREAASEGGIGGILMFTGAWDQALYHLERSLDLWQRADDSMGIAASLNSLGNAHYLRRQFQAAEEYYGRSLVLAGSLDDVVGRARALNNLGLIAISTGDYGTALDRLLHSLRLREELGERAGTVGTLTNIGNVYRFRGNYEQALLFHTRSLDLSRQLDSNAGASTAHGNIGNLHYLAGRYEAARREYESALALAEQSKSRRVRANLYLNLAMVHDGQGDHERALAYLRQALELEQEAGGRSGAATERRYVAAIHLEQGRFDQALLVARQAERLGQEIGGPEAQWGALTLIGQALLGLGRFEAARAPLEQAVELLETKRSEGDGELAQPLFFETELAPLRALVELELRQERPGEALIQAERVKAAALLDILGGESRVEGGESEPVSLAEIEGLLEDSGSVIVEYVVGERLTQVIAIRRDPKEGGLDYLYSTLEIDAESLRRRVDEFRSRLAMRDLGYRTEARSLHQLLLEPVEPWLRGSSSVVLVPDGSLWDLPFQALVDGEDRFLVERGPLAYAPSLTLLREMRTLRRPVRADGGRWLALAGPDLPLGGSADSTSPRSVIAPLPEAASQVQRLQGVWGAERVTPLVGSAATELAALEGLANHRLVHVAGRAVLNNRAPPYSYLQLEPDSKTVGADGWLEAREILPLTLQADLVVLPSCDTVRGRAGAGDGLRGLSWALSVAGVRAVVISQWPVDVPDTLGWIGRFHRELEQRSPSLQLPLGTAEALRAAAVSMLRDPSRRHPFYWAGFLVVGDGR